MLEKYIEKASVLIEALPYIKEFGGFTVVIKYGGSALVNDEIKSTIMQDIALMKLVGINPVIVHGGGPEINKMLEKLDIKPKFIDGLRVTDEQTMEVVEMILAGKINKSITSDLNGNGIKAVGICGKDANTITVKKLMPKGNDLGLVGEVDFIDVSLIKTLQANDFVPVISPIGTDKEGKTYNVNADYAAVSIAAALKAEKLIYLTDVEGVRRDAKDSASVMSRLSADKVLELIKDGTINGGMIPKVMCCVDGVKAGVPHVHILDGRVKHSLILEIFTKLGVGTLIEK